MINFNFQCPKCESRNLDFGKIINIKKIKQFMYYQKCKSCGDKRFIKRTQEVFNLVKDRPWELSKKTAKRVKRGEVNRWN
jgi:transcription elongation factor Elf1